MGAKAARISKSLYPFAIAAGPVLQLLMSNRDQISWGLAIRPLAISVLISLILYAGFRIAAGDRRKAGLITALIVLYLLSYGQFYSFLKAGVGISAQVIRHRYLVPGTLLPLGIFITWILFTRKKLDSMVTFLSIASWILLIIPLVSLTLYMGRSVHSTGRLRESGELSQQAGLTPGSESKPDVYYLILDGYAGENVLAEIYGFDNSSFLRTLESQGFYVASESRSNYSATIKSLSSSLNMQYLQAIFEQEGIAPPEENLPVELLKQNEVMRLFETLGYETVTFETGWANTTIVDSDIYLRPGGEVQAPAYLSWALNEFEILFLRSTLARVVIDFQTQRFDILRGPVNFLYQKHRDRIFFTLQTLEEIPHWDGEYFVFAHIISPHPPFVFGSNGERLNPSWEFTLQDGDAFPGSREQYIEGYSSQIAYLNKLLQATIVEILRDSEEPPVIIIQGDHGPRAYLAWDSIEETDLDETFSILNAYYLPPGAAQELYPTITPVNSFRVVFNRLFGGSYPLLEDRSYFTTYSEPLEFILVDPKLEDR